MKTIEPKVKLASAGLHTVKTGVIALGLIVFLSGSAGAAGADVFVMPTPQKAVYLEQSLALAGDDGASRVCLWAPENCPPQIEYALSRIQSAISAMGGPALPISRGAVPDEKLDWIVIDYLGGGPMGRDLVKAQNLGMNEEYPGVEGYFIKFLERGGKTTALCMGADPRGAYYAVESLAQLIFKDDSGIRLRLADIEDWPDFKFRVSSSAAEMGLDAIRYLAGHKLNVLGFHYPSLFQWRKPDEKYTEQVRSACEFARDTGAADIIQYINPYGNPRHGDRAEYRVNVNNPGDIEALVDAFGLSLGHGGKYVMLCVDDFFNVTPEEDAVFSARGGRFGARLAVQSFLANETHRRLKEKHPDCSMLFCPQPYHKLDGNTLDWYAAIASGIPAEIGLVWTGPEVFTHVITGEDMSIFTEHTGIKPFYWDNTIFRAHTPDVVVCLFDPYMLGNDYPAKFHDMLFRGGVHINSGAAELYNITLATAADYLWNPDAYDPHVSLARAAARYAGPDAGPLLVEYRELLIEMLVALNLTRRRPEPLPDHRRLPAIARPLRELARELAVVRHKLAAHAGTEALMESLWPYNTVTTGPAKGIEVVSVPGTNVSHSSDMKQDEVAFLVEAAEAVSDVVPPSVRRNASAVLSLSGSESSPEVCAVSPVHGMGPLTVDFEDYILLSTSRARGVAWVDPGGGGSIGGLFCQAAWKVSLPPDVEEPILVMAYADNLLDGEATRHVVEIVVNDRVVHSCALGGGKVMSPKLAQAEIEAEPGQDFLVELRLRSGLDEFRPCRVVATPVYLVDCGKIAGQGD